MGLAASKVGTTSAVAAGGVRVRGLARPSLPVDRSDPCGDRARAGAAVAVGVSARDAVAVGVLVRLCGGVASAAEEVGRLFEGVLGRLLAGVVARLARCSGSGSMRVHRTTGQPCHL